MQSPFPHGDDEPGLFGKRNEVAWRDKAMLGVMPAHQRLTRLHLACLHIPDRLIIELKLTLFQRNLQICLEPTPRLLMEARAWVKQHLGAATFGLGLVQRNIRVRQKFIGADAVHGG